MYAEGLPPRYRDTAMDCVKGINLKGKLAVVTGGSSGIGIETVRALAHAGANLIVPVRDLERSKKVIDEIKSSTKNDNIEMVKCDLASLKSVREACAEIKKKDQPINILLLNAGVMAIPQLELTEDGFEMTTAVNFIANALIISELTPLLIRGAPSRVVAVTSCAHIRSDVNWDDINFKQNYEKFAAYASAKTAIIHFVNEFNRRHSSEGVTGFTVHPGGIMTNLQNQLSDEEKLAFGWVDKDGNVNPLFKNTEQGAATAVWASTTPDLDGKGGLYCEDCSISKPTNGQMQGHGKHIYNEESEKRVWKIAEESLGHKL